MDGSVWKGWFVRYDCRDARPCV